jgi:hypothetical protein
MKTSSQGPVREERHAFRRARHTERENAPSQKGLTTEENTRSFFKAMSKHKKELIFIRTVFTRTAMPEDRAPIQRE